MSRLAFFSPEKSETVAGQAVTDQVLKMAQALSDPVRLRILVMLLAGRVGCCQTELPDDLTNPDAICVCEIMSNMGLIQSKASYHLAKLKAAGLVQEERRGRWNYYSVNRQALADFAKVWGEFVGIAQPE